MLKYKRLYLDSPELFLPKPGDAGYDLRAYGQYLHKHNERVVISTGIAVQIPEGYVGLIWDRSSMSFLYAIARYGGGVIDSSYRGEIKILLHNNGEDRVILSGDKVAQLIIVPYFAEETEEADTLDDNVVRGNKGFGSTGR